MFAIPWIPLKIIVWVVEDKIKERMLISIQQQSHLSRHSSVEFGEEKWFLGEGDKSECQVIYWHKEINTVHSIYFSLYSFDHEPTSTSHQQEIERKHRVNVIYI